MEGRFGPRPARPGSPITRIKRKAKNKERHTLIHSRPSQRWLTPLAHNSSGTVAQFYFGADKAGPWGQKFPTVVGAWRRVWDKVIPFFAFPPEVRRVIYTTNAIESVNARLRKIIKTRGHFPSDDAATKLIWLALRNITEDWGRAANNWKSAMNQFAILYEDRFTKSST